MRQSLLELVQTTLSLMDSDAVDSINETEESIQVADIAKDVYYELVGRQDWPWLYGAISVTAAADAAAPTKFTLDNSVRRITQFRYNVDTTAADPAYTKMVFLSLEAFLDRNSTGGDDTLEVSDGQLHYFVDLDRSPTCYTELSDGVLVCDAVDQTLESTLQGSKVSVVGYNIPTFTISDGFTPTLPDNVWPWYAAEVRKACFLYLKQIDSVRDSAVIIRQTAQARRTNRTGKRTYFNTNHGRR